MKVINIYADEYNYSIMRPGLLGNPYRIGRDGTRQEVIEKFEVYAKRTPRVMALIKSLSSNTILGCCCKPLPCHGDVIVQLWEEIHEQTCEDEGCPHYNTPHAHPEKPNAT